MLLGVLDIGSNSAQLQVVEVRAGAPPLPTHAVKAPTLLGEAFDADGSIDIAGADRVVEAVQRALEAARRLGVEQLYVLSEWAGSGVGTRLLEVAKALSPSGLQLWTFESNTSAQAFYAHHGFTVAEQTNGAGNEERQPAVRMVWRP